MKKVHLVVAEDGKSRVLTHEEEPTLAQMQEAVGGLIQYVPLVNGAQTMPLPASVCGGVVRNGTVTDVIVNEEGLLMRMAPNMMAMLAAWGPDAWDGDYNVLVGPAIVVIEYDEEAERADRDQFMLRALGDEGSVLVQPGRMPPSAHLDNGRVD